MEMTTQEYILDACEKYSIILNENQLSKLEAIVEERKIANDYNDMLITHGEGINMIIDAIIKLRTEEGYKTSGPPQPRSIHLDE
ncbi:MAG: hypothetical protein M9931_01255 [Chitinophagales bacterium]|nr:hypothetical protein [Chitinophagales bacterium]MCO5279663.1 hypothetical protein [Chitinophagales bacterium]HRN93088.1 hypothetical protein [Chitinophagales bacterium]HRP39818.1 hypothetical protein [Chitinophagales bacterium]